MPSTFTQPTRHRMRKPVFISYNFLDDREYAHNIGVFFRPDAPCQGTPRFVRNVVNGDTG